MDALEILAQTTGRGWTTSEFWLAVLSIVAILAWPQSATASLAIGIIAAAYALARAWLKAATSRALLEEIEPPTQLAEVPVASSRPTRT